MLKTVLAIAGISIIAGLLVRRVIRVKQRRNIQIESVSDGNNASQASASASTGAGVQNEAAADLSDSAYPAADIYTAGAASAVLVQPDKPSVLLVDDHPLMRQLMNEVLTQAGVGVVSAGDCHEALQLLSQYKFEMLLSDVQMPGMDGIELLRRLRAMKGSSNAAIPCVFMTGSLDDSKRREADRLGALAFFTKPFDIHAIAQFIATELEKEQRIVSP
ncbi:response regulator receiver domain-containing protein [Paenibacillus cellulosilyticus]|uniref:Response regulator receiver domain-containing protein n=1 Tax=Paenibacillus cellulosilyticus TaxID=375489 RepID=A0A2V2YVB9_9BACL|nr:response regulator [Paenibacillus cellulosilyticus]PWW00729.1 response regulator receiver domain-containing protein [Paenibacillus cellulosilyticus]QKS45585.1 response regulator [Paenibacillus cellulosilyticus]